MDLRRFRNDLLALCLLALCVFLALCLWSYDSTDPPARIAFPARVEPLNAAGLYGAQTAHYLRTVFGLGSLYLVFSLFTFDMRLFSRNGPTDHAVRIFGVLLVLTGLCVGLQLFAPELGGGPAIGSGGYVGAWGIAILEQYFTQQGLTILVATSVTAGVLIAGELFLLQLAWAIPTLPFRIVARLSGRRPGPVRRKVDLDEDPDGPDDEDEPDSEVASDQEAPARSKAGAPIKVNPPIASQSLRDEVIERLEAGSAASKSGPYELPSLDFLEPAEDFPYETLAKKAQGAAAVLEKTFKDFGLNVRVVEIDTGPVITQFELELEAGLRLSKVAALADDLAIALRVPSVRVVPSIPGKNTVGVEVPNEKQVLVRLRELIEACPDAIDKMRIPMFLGKDVSGRPWSSTWPRCPTS